MARPFNFIQMGGKGPPLLFLHATGFHGRVFEPLAARLSGKFNCIAVDLPGHGTSAAAECVWYDALNLASLLSDAVEAQGLRQCFCFGHSGGAALALLAEATHPGTFAAMYLYEAVVSTPELYRAAKQQAEQQQASGQEPSSAARQLARMALKRQAVFENPEHAYQQLTRKPPFSAMHPSVLREYFKHGLVQVNSASEQHQEQQQQQQGPAKASRAPGWHLVCSPTAEASWYTMFDPPVCITPDSIHCPVLLAGHGATAGIHSQLPLANEAVAATLPRAQYHSFAGLSHFGPLEQPELVASHVKRFLGQYIDLTPTNTVRQEKGWQQEKEKGQVARTVWEEQQHSSELSEVARKPLPSDSKL
jgi:pimeloyl-ACP methyl ester carboxylesterase